MVHYFVGNLGHFLVILAFVASLVATVSYFIGSRESSSWTRFANVTFIVHGVAIFGVVATLFFIIHNHYFEYHYAWDHASNLLPWYYQISCFWEGQEGSFLLWMFWNVLIGFVLIRTNRDWRPSVMAVLSLTQLFLTSMILGVVVLGSKVGSSPFMLLRDVIDAPIFKTSPDFIPEDGSGLNPLLQNYWMVIHPPTLFLGFATTVVPFAFCIAGILRGKFKEWIRPALPWAQFSTLVLGVGILMGAYWAYETLNFGGYWNWDPVENAIYVPWLVMVAAVHTMIVHKNNGSAIKLSMGLVVTTFVLILYSTFLVRSGVLGETSVHSFTDLGLSGQLLIYLTVFVIGSIWLLARAWKKIPTKSEEVSPYTREFWIFLGAATLGLMAFQVILPTSIPVWNRIVEFFGDTSNLAPPTDQIEFYSRIQLLLAMVLAILSGTGQFFWWNKLSGRELRNRILPPVGITLLLVSLVAYLDFFDRTAGMAEIGWLTWVKYLAFFTAALYSLVSNFFILVSLVKKNIRLSGGAVAHMGIAMMLIGILFSSGYSKILSLNYTGYVWNQEFPDEVNQNNLLLFQNEARQMGDYSMVYKGMRKLTKEAGFVEANELFPIAEPNKMILGRGFEEYQRGDTLSLINFEDSYFEVFYQKADGSTFTLYPRVQMNDAMGVVYSPDIQMKWHSDIYTHVRTFPDPEVEPEWSEMDSMLVAEGERFFVNDYVAEFKGIEPINEISGRPLREGDLALKAVIDIQGEYRTYRAEPIFVIQDLQVGRIKDQVNDLGAQITILSIDPEAKKFLFGIRRTQKDWIIMEAVEKPYINLLWIGTFLLVVGLVIAIFRRYREFQLMRDKSME